MRKSFKKLMVGVLSGALLLSNNISSVSAVFSETNEDVFTSDVIEEDEDTDIITEDTTEEDSSNGKTYDSAFVVDSVDNATSYNLSVNPVANYTDNTKTPVDYTYFCVDADQLYAGKRLFCKIAVDIPEDSNYNICIKPDVVSKDNSGYKTIVYTSQSATMNTEEVWSELRNTYQDKGSVFHKSKDLSKDTKYIIIELNYESVDSIPFVNDPKVGIYVEKMVDGIELGDIKDFNIGGYDNVLDSQVKEVPVNIVDSYSNTEDDDFKNGATTLYDTYTDGSIATSHYAKCKFTIETSGYYKFVFYNHVSKWNFLCDMSAVLSKAKNGLVSPVTLAEGTTDNVQEYTYKALDKGTYYIFISLDKDRYEYTGDEYWYTDPYVSVAIEGEEYKRTGDNSGVDINNAIDVENGGTSKGLSTTYTENQWFKFNIGTADSLNIIAGVTSVDGKSNHLSNDKYSFCDSEGRELQKGYLNDFTKSDGKTFTDLTDTVYYIKLNDSYFRGSGEYSNCAYYSVTAVWNDEEEELETEAPIVETDEPVIETKSPVIETENPDSEYEEEETEAPETKEPVTTKAPTTSSPASSVKPSSTVAPTNTPSATASVKPTATVKPTQSPDNDDEDEDEYTTTKSKEKKVGTPKLTSYKRGSKLLKGSCTSGATCVVKVGNKTYKKKASGGKFIVKLKAKLKKGTKIVVYATKSGYLKSVSKTYRVK